jgi:peptidoglycan-N-acetylglucosamine deacetylase
MRYVSLPVFTKLVFPNIIKSFPDKKGKLFLTFDDGPDPETTPAILELLKTYHARATFFCLGEKVLKFPSIFQSIIDSGHSVGNHGYSHISGYKCSLETFKNNVEKGNKLINSSLFRPPYGKIKFVQYLWLKQHYKIVLWDVLTYDFDPDFSAEDILNVLFHRVTEGSIIVFHDSAGSREKIENVLPKFFELFKGIECSSIDV